MRLSAVSSGLRSDLPSGVPPYCVILDTNRAPSVCGLRSDLPPGVPPYCVIFSTHPAASVCGLIFTCSTPLRSAASKYQPSTAAA